MTRHPYDATREAGGVDWLEYCVYGEFDATTWPILREQLVDAKRLASKADDGRCLMRSPDRVAVLSVQAGGKGRGYSYCAFNLQIEGISLGICDRRESGGTAVTGKHGVPIVYVRATGLTCLVRGWQWVRQRASEILSGMGFKWHTDAVSRLDMATDVLGVHVRDFMRAFMEGRVVRVTKAWAIWGDGEFSEIQTMRLGSTDGLNCRIYDKLAETKESPSTRELMRLLRWGVNLGEPDPASATRIEFQLRREDLKGQGLDTLADVEKGLGNVLEYLTTKWLRFTSMFPDRKNRNQDRAGIMPKWAKVQRESKRWFASKAGFQRSRVPTIGSDEKHLTSMGVGILGRLLAGRDDLPATKERCHEAVGKWLDENWRMIGAKAALRRLDLEDSQPDKGVRVREAYVRESVPLDERLAGVAQMAGE